jgi:hypothetical protein
VLAHGLDVGTDGAGQALGLALDVVPPLQQAQYTPVAGAAHSAHGLQQLERRREEGRSMQRE